MSSFWNNSGGDELGSAGDDHLVQGLQGEGGGAVSGHGGMGQLGNSGCDGIVIMYWDYLGRVMRMCQASCLRVIIMGQLEEYLMRY